jgi:hypothetical protein
MKLVDCGDNDYEVDCGDVVLEFSYDDIGDAWTFWGARYRKQPFGRAERLRLGLFANWLTESRAVLLAEAAIQRRALRESHRDDREEGA